MQKTELKTFKDWWPTVQSLQTAFQPKNCCKVLANEVKAATEWPQVTLNQIGVIYNNNDLSMYFVRLMYSTIYAQVNNGVINNNSVLDMECGNFLARYGHTCTMFDLMLYMATYRNTYKPDYISNGDLSDIVKRFPEYMKHKALVMEAHKPQPKTEARTKEQKELVGIEAMKSYLRKAAERGDNLLEGGLVTFGMVTREHAKEVMDAYGPKAF